VPTPESDLLQSVPWRIERPHDPVRAPEGLEAEVVVVGAGLTGLATARELLGRRPGLDLAVVEARLVGGGASGASGAIVLEGTAGDDLPELTGCLAALERVVRVEQIACALELDGCWVVGRSKPIAPSPIAWNDSGALRVIGSEPGGAVDAGALLGGLWRAVEQRGARVFEQSPIEQPPRARAVVMAADAAGLRLAGLAGAVTERWTFAIALDSVDFAALGWADRRPFYTGDLPYLWGRALPGARAIIGGGLGPVGDLHEARALFARLEARVHALHPALAAARVTHRWAGPISFSRDWQPVIGRVENVHYAGGYAGHGVALAFRVAERIADAVLGNGG
jgi:glycine/D-amino acid oxidase-like deaminating enzyme